MTDDASRVRQIVAASAAGGRLDHFLTQGGSFGTRSQVQRLIAAGRVLVNGRAVKAGVALRIGDEVSVEPLPAEHEPSRNQAEDIPLDVLYEDEDILVIDKPVGLVVHPAPGHGQGTLVNALLHRWRGAPTGLDELRPGIVHRLDRDTSGVLVIGRSAEVVMRLSAQFRSREVSKEYLAVVWRNPRPKVGVIDKPLGRHPTRRKRMAIRDGGRPALTRYEVVEEFGDLTLLRVRPETGRTHQIRVHLASLGHPILGDVVYGRARAVADSLVRDFPRQALHAARLELEHPRSGQRITFEAPLPADLEALLAHLRKRGKARSSGGIA
jgi:23S rRNA pseudouridine1911/1915/1917 synthase